MSILRARRWGFLMMIAFIGICTCNSASAGLIVSTVHWRIEDGGNGHYYQLVLPDLNEEVTWQNAEATLESRGGYLATVTSAAENDFLRINFQSLLDVSFGRHGNLWAWIGLSDEAREGVYKWVTGEPYGFSNWLAGEPNNLFNEDYVHYKVRAEFTNELSWAWNDAPVTPNFMRTYGDRFAYIGEFSANPVPEPNTLLLAGSCIILLAVWQKLVRKRIAY